MLQERKYENDKKNSRALIKRKRRFFYTFPSFRQKSVKYMFAFISF
jgi:hypothetical protein